MTARLQFEGEKWISPATAQEWLEKFNKHNRPVKNAHVKRLAQAMKEGRFVFNGDPIRFNTKGELMDGQHRLMACVQSGVPFKATVIWNVPDNAFPTIDVGKKRTGTDVLHIEGYANPSAVSAAATLLYRYQNGEIQQSRSGKALNFADPQTQLEVAKDNPKLLDAVSWCVSNGLRKHQTMSVAVAAVLYYLYRDTYPEQTTTFLRQVRDGVNLEPDNPAYHYREYLLHRSRALSHETRDNPLRYGIKAMNYFVSGKTMSKLMLRKNEGNPVPWIIKPVESQAASQETETTNERSQEETNA